MSKRPQVDIERDNQRMAERSREQGEQWRSGMAEGGAAFEHLVRGGLGRGLSPEDALKSASAEFRKRFPTEFEEQQRARE